MNKKLKILFVIVLVVYQIFCMSYEVFGASGSSLVESFAGDNGINSKDGETLITKIITPILSVIRIVAIGIGIIVITFLGIKYMSAAPTEKASIKNQLVTFTIGLSIVIATTTILDIIKTTVMKITT